MQLARTLLASILVLSLLSACGGGGGGGGGGGSLNASPTSVAFNAQINGSVPPSQDISIQPTGDAWDVVAGYPPGTSSASWLSMSFSDTHTLRLSVGNTSLSEGTRTTTVRIATRRITGETIAYRDIAVSYTLTASLTVSSNALDFDVITGAATPAAQSLTLSGGSLAWTASVDQPWVSLSATLGTSPGSTQVSVNPSGLAEGQHQATITFTETRSGRTLPVAVTFNLNPRRLLVSDNGIALTSAPGASRLTDTLRVRDNAGLTSVWTASSSQAWLTVTNSGTTDDDLVLTADPAGLAADTVHYATVTVSSTTPSIQPDTVRIGFYVQAASAVAQPVSVTSNMNRVADPIRPYLYLTRNTSGTVSVYNIYSGASASIAVGSALGPIEVSSDGSHLYVYDNANRNVVVIDLDTRTEVGRWLAPDSYPYAFFMRYLRPNGRSVLATARAIFVNADDGQVLGSIANAGGMSAFMATADSRYAVMYTTFSRLQRFAMEFSEHGQALRLRTTHGPLSVSLAGAKMGLNADATRLYFTTGTSTLTTYMPSGSSFVLGTPAPANSGLQGVHRGPHGKVYYSAWTFPQNAVSLWNYGPGDAMDESYATTAGFFYDIAISGDGLRALLITDSQFTPWAIGP